MDKLGVVFDFEGTLVDFQWRLENGEREARKVLQPHMGDVDLSSMNYAELYNEAAKRGISHLLDPIYDRYDMDALSRWSLRDGALEVLEFLRRMGLRLGLLSNVGRKALSEALERFFLTPFFQAVVSRDDVELIKPHPSGLRMLLSTLGLDASHALYVGDSLADLSAARSLGVDVVIIPLGEEKRERFLDLGHTRFMDSLNDVKRLFGG